MSRPASGFTGKERDSESGLDMFGARYNASSMGRFMAPDPLLNSGHPADPQTWNRYSYVLNNPLRYTDPFGLYVWGNCSGNADQCKADQQRFRDSITKTQEALKGLDPNSKEAKRKSGTDEIITILAPGHPNAIFVGSGLMIRLC